MFLFDWQVMKHDVLGNQYVMMQLRRIIEPASQPPNWLSIDEAAVAEREASAARTIGEVQ